MPIDDNDEHGRHILCHVQQCGSTHWVVHVSLLTRYRYLCTSLRSQATMSCDGDPTTGSMQHIYSRWPASISRRGRGYSNGKSKKGFTRRSKEAMANTKVRKPSTTLANHADQLSGTWIPLVDGRHLAEKNGILDRLIKIFDYVPGDRSPPPAPKHATAASNKPKVNRQPVPPQPRKPPPPPTYYRPANEQYEHESMQYEEQSRGTSPAQESFLEDDDFFPQSQNSTAYRNRKRD